KTKALTEVTVARSMSRWKCSSDPAAPAPTRIPRIVDGLITCSNGAPDHLASTVVSPALVRTIGPARDASTPKPPSAPVVVTDSTKATETPGMGRPPRPPPVRWPRPAAASWWSSTTWWWSCSSSWRWCSWSRRQGAPGSQPGRRRPPARRDDAPGSGPQLGDHGEDGEQHQERVEGGESGDAADGGADARLITLLDRLGGLEPGRREYHRAEDRPDDHDHDPDSHEQVLEPPRAFEHEPDATGEEHDAGRHVEPPSELRRDTHPPCGEGGSFRPADLSHR